MQAIQSKVMEKRYCVACIQIRIGNKLHKPSAPVGFRFKAFCSIATQLLVVLYQMLWFKSLSFTLDFGYAMHHILLAHNIYMLRGSSIFNGGRFMMLPPPTHANIGRYVPEYPITCRK